MGRFPVDINEVICFNDRLVKKRALQLCFNVGEVPAAHFDVGSSVPQFISSTELDAHGAVAFGAINRTVSKIPFRHVKFHRRHVRWAVHCLLMKSP